MVNIPTHNQTSHEQGLPNGRLIFDLITLNDLDAIHSLLTPLALHDRQRIVYQKFDRKSLLFHACELGYKDIAKYLLDECGADIDDGFCGRSLTESPVVVATHKLDLLLTTLLLRRGASVRAVNRGAHCINNADSNRYNSLVTILTIYGKKVNGINLLKPRPKGKRRAGSFDFYEKGSTEYERRNKLFLNAVTYGGTPTIKSLLRRGVNRSFQNNKGENGLCLAILNGQHNTINFLLNYKTYTPRSYVQALELCGAKFLVYLSDTHRGLECWRKSIEIRQEYCIGFLDKCQMRSETDLGIEFETEEELDELNQRNLQLQALLVFIRLLPRYNEVTRGAFRIVAQNRMFRQDIHLCLKILSELYYYTDIAGLSVPYPTQHAIETMDNLFSTNFKIGSDNKAEYLLKFGKLFHVLCQLIRKDYLLLYDIAFEELLSYVISNIQFMERYDLSQEERQWIENGISTINKNNPSLYSTTLLHETIQRKSPLSVVAFVLNCSCDPNCCTRLKNTPLHTVCSVYKRRSHHSIQLTNLLIEAGAHIDSVNQSGARPLERLHQNGLVDNPLKYLSLQCLAAQAIHRSGVAVPKNFPEILVDFIKIHSK